MGLTKVIEDLKRLEADITEVRQHNSRLEAERAEVRGILLAARTPEQERADCRLDFGITDGITTQALARRATAPRTPEPHTADEFQRLSMRTRPLDKGHQHNLSEAALGLAGEAGEAVDMLKKHLYHGKALDSEAMKLELGDVAHYLAAIAGHLDMPLSEVLQANLEKLRRRHPDGWDPGYHHQVESAKVGGDPE